MSISRVGGRHLALFLAVLVAALAVLFDRTWRPGEVFSPADAIEIFFPWAYDTARPVPTNLTRTDEAFFHQPLMMTHWARLKAGDFPEWDPLVLSGVPAFFQGLDTGRAFSPMSLPFYLAPADVAVTLYAPLRLLCAGLFMWLFLRDRGHGPVAAGTGGVAFALNGAFLTWLSAPMPTVALFLPLVLLGVDRTAARGSSGDIALLGLAVGCALLGAYLPTSLAVLAACGVYALDALWQKALEQPQAPAASDPSGARVRAPDIGVTALRLAIGGLAGLALAAVALVPMLVSLAGSPASGRSMLGRTLPASNLATFALPDFWGSPLSRNWWFPADGNYPELVSYFGVTTLALAGAGLVAAVRARDRRTLVLAVLALFSLAMMYGWPPASWAALLPGFRQMNPFRWNVVLACGVAVLAAAGLDALRGRRRGDRDVESHEATIHGTVERDTRASRDAWWALAGVAVTLFALGAVASAALATHVDVIRRLNLQAFEKAQVWRFLLLGSAVVALALLAVVDRRWRWSTSAAGTPLGAAFARAAALAALGFPVLVAADLVWFGHGFNPTIARERLYPTRPGIERLRLETGQGRAAPVDPRTELVPGHIWSVFGIEVVTGFDFFGDREYQRLIDRVTLLAPRPARWDHVNLDGPRPPDLRLLGLLNVTTLVTSPVDVVSRGAGFGTLGELTDGHVVRQAFTAAGPTRAIDVLVGTYRRRNAGTITLALEDASGRRVAQRQVEASALADNAWLRLDLSEPTAPGPTTVVVEAHGSGPGSAITLWTVGAPASPAEGLRVGPERVPGALVFRTFSPLPQRFAGTELVYSGDLNIYRNRLAQPRAWFVRAVDSVPAAQHLDRLKSPSLDISSTAVIDGPLPVAPTASARVLRVDTSQADRRRFEVEAPAGGVLLVSERHAAGWRAWADGAPLEIRKADAVLMAVGVPPGTREVVLQYDSPALPASLAVSGLAALGIALAALPRRRRPREVPGRVA
jgi:hypothetical protein